MKLLALVLSLATLSTACTKTSTMAGGAVLAGGGALLLGVALTADTSCPQDDVVCGVVVEPAAKTAQFGAGTVGVLGLVAGLALLAAGSKIESDAAARPTTTARPLVSRDQAEPAPPPPNEPPTSMGDAPTPW